MMKKLILILLIIESANTSVAQTSNSFRKEDYDIKQFKKKQIEISIPKSTIQLSEVSSIEIVDARPDTSAIGFMQRGFKKPVFVILHEGLRNEMQSFVNKYFHFSQSDSSYKILMVIKKLWLTDEFELKEDSFLNKQKRSSGLFHKDSTSGIAIKIEFYIQKKQNYYALYRYDSTLQETYSVLNYGSEYLIESFTNSFSKLSSIETSLPKIIANRRAFNIEEISNHISQNFDLRILKDTLLKKGVYMSFEEFKNNSPSVSDFEVKKEKLIDMLYIKQPDGTEYGPRNIWGYCDGQNSFVQSFNNFFLLQKKENAFYIYGAKKIISDNSSQSTYVPPTYGSQGQVISPGGFMPMGGAGNPKLELKPFLLDWDTGKLY
ncbi:MAG TPA: hypothetical protein VKT28_10340 [Puia sp.]|nr:hypothetical protein [Puia sp.]